MNTTRWSQSRLALIFVGVFLLITMKSIWNLSNVERSVSKIKDDLEEDANALDEADEDSVQNIKLADDGDDEYNYDDPNSDSGVDDNKSDQIREVINNKEHEETGINEADDESLKHNEGVDDDNKKDENAVDETVFVDNNEVVAEMQNIHTTGQIIKEMVNDADGDTGQDVRQENNVEIVKNAEIDMEQNLNHAPLKESESIDGPLVTDKVYFEFTINDVDAGRVEVGLFANIAPLTVTNFKSLCQGFTNPRGNLLTYKGTRIYRLVKNFVLQAGEISRIPGETSIYDKPFKDESFALKHSGAGWVNMANSGPDTNTSHFCFLLGRADHLDSHFVIFGKVLAGMPVLRHIESLQTYNDSSPVDNIIIKDCGVIDVPTPFVVDYEPSNENV